MRGAGRGGASRAPIHARSNSHLITLYPTSLDGWLASPRVPGTNLGGGRKATFFPDELADRAGSGWESGGTVWRNRGEARHEDEDFTGGLHTFPRRHRGTHRHASAARRTATTTTASATPRRARLGEAHREGALHRLPPPLPLGSFVADVSAVYRVPGANLPAAVAILNAPLRSSRSTGLGRGQEGGGVSFCYSLAGVSLAMAAELQPVMLRARFIGCK